MGHLFFASYHYVASLFKPDNYSSGAVNVLSSFVFQLIVTLSGWIALLLTYSWRRLRRRAIRRRIEKAHRISYSNRELLVLSGSEFEIKREDIATHWRIRDDFYISFPEERRKEMSDLKPDYVFRDDQSSPILVELSETIRNVVPDLDKVLQEGRARAAEITIERARQSNRVFNGFVFQAYDIVPSVIDDKDENPTVSFIVYRTDYFTLTTFYQAFRLIRGRQEVRQQWADQTMPRMLRLLYNGIGLNVVVVAIDEADGSMNIVLRKRSARAMQTAATGQWHVTANEALSTTEVEETEILIETWVRRALKEEAGFKTLGPYFIFGCFLALEDMQPGMTVLAFCRYSHDNLQNMLDSSKDGVLEYGATKLIQFDDVSIGEVLKGTPGIMERDGRVPLSASAESILRGVAARGVDTILARAGLEAGKSAKLTA